MPTPQAIEWPEITVGGRRFTLRFSYSAQYQLTRWGKTLADATAIEVAAACAGHFEPNGTWRSEGFEKPVHLADLFQPGDDEAAMIVAVTEAIKKAYPELAVSAPQTPEVESALKTESSVSGPSPSPVPA